MHSTITPRQAPCSWRAIITDGLLWAIIILMLFGLFRFGRWLWHGGFSQTPSQVLSLDFNDASQLTKGSPVHFMGANIGYVQRVQAKIDHVSVILKTFPNTPKIPDNARITIEFNGLAGAKSLEILPPSSAFEKHLSHEPYYWTLDMIHPSDRFLAEEPIRIRDLFKTQQIGSEAVEMAYNNIYSLLGRVENEKEILLNLTSVNKFMNKLRVDMQGTAKTLRFAHTESHQIAGNILNTTHSFEGTLKRIEPYTRRDFIDQNVKPNVKSFISFIDEFETTLGSHQANDGWQRVQQRIQQWQLAIANGRFIAERLFQGLDSFHSSMQKADQGLTTLRANLKKKPLKERLNEFEQKTQTWVEKTRKLEKAI